MRFRFSVECRPARTGRLMLCALRYLFDGYESYILFLETKLNGCNRRWYGKTKEHKALIKEGKPLPPWHTVNIKCHDFRVTFCTMCYDAGIPIKTLQKWMGHADATMIMRIYAKLTNEREQEDITAINNFTKVRFKRKNSDLTT